MKHSSPNDPDYDRQERDDDLIGRHLIRQNELQSVNARRHLVNGFNRRVLMLESSRNAIEKITQSPTDRPIGVYKAMELGIQLNAYYLNICGALDNLAWALQYEWNVIPAVTEAGKGSQQCGLFVSRFIKALHQSRPSLAESIEEFKPWYRELRMLRDPAAHRIPLYASPGTITTEVDAAEFDRLQVLAAEEGKKRNHNEMMELQHQAFNLGRYVPMMVIWTPEGERSIHIWSQLIYDHAKFQRIAACISEAILPS